MVKPRLVESFSDVLACLQVLDSIKSQVVTVHSLKESVFDDRGNGDIGFSLFNIQKDDLGYTYKLVSHFLLYLVTQC